MTAEKRAAPTAGVFEVRFNGAGEREIYAGDYGICIMYGGFEDGEEAANARLFVEAKDTAAECDRLKVDNAALAGVLGKIARTSSSFPSRKMAHGVLADHGPAPEGDGT